jgi:hypothetical protein
MTEFPTVKRVVPKLPWSFASVVNSVKYYHSYGPFIEKCLSGKEFEHQLINFDEILM